MVEPIIYGRKRSKPTYINMFEDEERDQNTAQCLSCFTTWKTKKLNISKCPFCGERDNITITQSSW
jgi:rubrerythrin